MAKGRKLTQSRSERLLGTYGSYSHAYDSPELGEDDVWSMVNSVDEREDHETENSQGEWSPRAIPESNGGIQVRRGRRIPRDDHNVGGLSLAFDDSGKTVSSPGIVHQFRGQEPHDSMATSRGDHMATSRGDHMATSAPVNVPDWSKILRVDSVDSLYDMDDGLDGNDSEMIPPHEYLAREHTRGATSVFEGFGRTLKGRDMRRVRDAVWSRTGFDG